MPAERHPIADLLTLEERRRVLDYEWRLTPTGGLGCKVSPDQNSFCPIGVCLDVGRPGFFRATRPSPMQVHLKLKRAKRRSDLNVIQDFMARSDTGQISPADLPAVLGLEGEGEG